MKGKIEIRCVEYNRFQIWIDGVQKRNLYRKLSEDEMIYANTEMYEQVKE